MADPRRWFSGALKAAEMLPQNFGTAEQMNAMLRKYGAKNSELDYLKVPTFLQQFKSRVPKQALVDYIDENKVLPKEIIKTGKDYSKVADDPEFWDAMQTYNIDAAEQPRLVPNFDDLSRHQRAEFIQNNADIVRETGDGLNYLNPRRWAPLPGTKYSDYATHPDAGYKETLVTLPQKKVQNSLAELINEPPLYQSSHWDEPNVLFHTRTSQAPTHSEYPGPSELPFLEELQSDWGQAKRRESSSVADQIARAEANVATNMRHFGPQDPIVIEDMAHLNYLKNSGQVKDAPLIGNTNDWASAGVRRFLLDAAEQDAPQIAWTTGAQQSARYSGHAPEGMSGFYDKLLSNTIQKYIKPFGGIVTPSSSLDMPHTATLPSALRKKLTDEGIPFFKHGGLLERYA